MTLVELMNYTLDGRRDMENVYGIEGTPELAWLKKTWSPLPLILWVTRS